jgi:Lrp/AsnC family transcriptional regulator for asnA, asnC and gidA
VALKESDRPSARFDPVWTGVAKFDDTDRAIFRRLEDDGRASFRSIGESLSLSEATVRHRTHRMVEEGLIQIVAIPNVLGSGRIIDTTVRLKVSKEPATVAEAIRDWPEVPWIALCNAEVVLTLYTDGVPALQEALQRLHELDGVAEVTSFICLETFKATYVLKAS